MNPTGKGPEEGTVAAGAAATGAASDSPSGEPSDVEALVEPSQPEEVPVLIEPAAAVSRLLGRLEVSPDGWSEAFFERFEVVELPGADVQPGVLTRREEGLAVRIVK